MGGALAFCFLNCPALDKRKRMATKKKKKKGANTSMGFGDLRCFYVIDTLFGGRRLWILYIPSSYVFALVCIVYAIYDVKYISFSILFICHLRLSSSCPFISSVSVSAVSCDTNNVCHDLAKPPSPSFDGKLLIRSNDQQERDVVQPLPTSAVF